MDRFFADAPARMLMLLVLFVAVVALVAYAQLAFTQARYVSGAPAIISVSGEGEVIAVPDVARFTFAVEAEGADASAAQSSSAEQMNEILTYLREQGLLEADIQTTGYNLYPRWRFEERVCPLGSFCPPGEQVQDGFTVSQSVAVKVRNLDVAGQLLSGVGERGATNLSGLNFTIDDMSALQAEARALAIADAQAKAKVLADSLGVKVTRLVGFYEDEGGYMPMPYNVSMDKMAMSEAAVTPDIPVGEQETVRRVTLTYEVQ